jgi:16S rRNA U516 pseudouridylate synthase RsuA-like enzyme
VTILLTPGRHGCRHRHGLDQRRDPERRTPLRQAPAQGHFLRLTASADLQAKASGLLVFTQDWKILRKLTADAAKIEQEYVVEVEGDMVAHGLNRLNHGLTYKARSCRR